MTRLLLALVTIVTVVAIAACGSTGHSRPSTSDSTPRASTAGTTAEHVAASVFAAAYVRFLDGADAAASLPDATTSVRALAGQAGPVPAAHSRGTLVLAELRGAPGQPGSYVLAATDAAHTFNATITLNQQYRRQLVTGITPPDFVQALAPPGPPSPPPPPGSNAPQHAAQAFLAGYLPWLYGHGPLRAIRDAATSLLGDLERRPPRVPLTIHSLHPKLVAIALQHHRRGWQALPNITDGRETYELVLTITQTRGRWLVSGVSNP